MVSAWVVFALGVLVGTLLMVAVDYWLLKIYWNMLTPAEPPAPRSYTKPTLAPALQEFLRKHPRPQQSHQRDELPEETCHALNFVNSFLFRELRDTIPVKRFFMKMFNNDFQTLKENTNLGRVLERVTVRDFDFGESFPTITSAALMRPKNGELGDSDELDIAVDIEYKGKFHLTVDADLILSKRATISVTVDELSGRARFALRHLPTPHYSFSFFEEPKIRFEAESIFEGRSLPQLTTLIINQMRRSIRKKHTLPAAKMRYKPFFPPPSESEDIDVDLYGRPLHAGHMRVTVVAVTELQVPRSGSHLYCALSLENKEEKDYAHRPLAGSLSTKTIDVELIKAGSGGSVGIVFKDTGRKNSQDEGCIIESIDAHSPAFDSKMQANDRIIRINGINIISPQQAVRIIKSSKDKVRITAIREDTLENFAAGDEDAAVLSRHTSRKDWDETAATWNETFEFEVDPDQRTLFIRLYDSKPPRQGKAPKDFLVGFAEVSLLKSALFSVSHRTAYRQRYTLHSSSARGAPVIGRIELILEHQPSLELVGDKTVWPTEAAGRPVGDNQGASATTATAAAASVGKATSPMSKAASPAGPAAAASAADSVASTPADTISMQSSDDFSSSLGASSAVADGTELFADLPPEERREQLNELMGTVQSKIELEAETRTELEGQLEEAVTVEQQCDIKEQILASDQRMHDLAVRMIRCVTAIHKAEEGSKA